MGMLTAVIIRLWSIDLVVIRMKTYDIQYFCKDSINKMRYWSGLEAVDDQEAFFLFHNKMRDQFNLTFRDFRIYDIVEVCE